MPDVLVVGSVNVDVVMRLPTIPRPGETIGNGELSRGLGGKGSNQAVAAARLGAHVQLVATVGDDDDGAFAVETLRREGVDCSLVTVTSGVATGVALVLVADDGENIVAVAPGANAQLQVPAGFAASLRRRRGVVLTCFEVPMPTVQAATAAGAECGWVVVVNPAPAVGALPTLPAGVTLTPNRHELEILSGAGDVPDAVRRLARATGCTVVATLGAQGSFLLYGDDPVLVDAVPVHAVDTTGAGDAFNGALAAALAADAPLDEAVRIATAVASYSTRALGAQAGYVTLPELRTLLGRPELLPALDTGSPSAQDISELS
jgi:ribokinase